LFWKLCFELKDDTCARKGMGFPATLRQLYVISMCKNSKYGNYFEDPILSSLMEHPKETRGWEV
jgi:hypothetical protein